MYVFLNRTDTCARKTALAKRQGPYENTARPLPKLIRTPGLSVLPVTRATPRRPHRYAPECPGHCGGHPSRLFHHDLVHEQESLAGARVPGRDRSGILRDHLQVTGRRFGKLHPVTPDAVGIPGLRFGHRDRGHLGKIRPVIRNPHRNRRGQEYPVALLGERLQLHRPIGLLPRPCRWSRRVARPDTPARHRS